MVTVQALSLVPIRSLAHLYLISQLWQTLEANIYTLIQLCFGSTCDVSNEEHSKHVCFHLLPLHVTSLSRWLRLMMTPSHRQLLYCVIDYSAECNLFIQHPGASSCSKLIKWGRLMRPQCITWCPMVCGGADVTVMGRLNFTELMYFITFRTRDFV